MVDHSYLIQLGHKYIPKQNLLKTKKKMFNDLLLSSASDFLEEEAKCLSSYQSVHPK